MSLRANLCRPGTMRAAVDNDEAPLVAGQREHPRSTGPEEHAAPFVEVHEGDGPALLLVHGMLAGRALWSANLDELRHVCTPVVVELFGHGRSPSPTDRGRYAPDAYVADLERIRRERAIDRWLLFGHSLGAAITLRYALAHPDRVIGHAFTNSASALADDTWRRRVRVTAEDDARRIETGGRTALARHPLNPARSKRVVQPVRDALAVDGPLLDPVGVAESMRAAVAAESLRERVTGNTRPCLLVAGVREAAFEEPTALAEAVMPDLVTVRVEAGHSPNAEVPEAFNTLLGDFVRSVS